MSLATYNPELWGILLEKCTYRDIRRLFMTGSVPVRRAVASIRSMEIIDCGPSTGALALASSLPQLRHLIVRPREVLHRGLDEPKLPLGYSELRSLQILPNFGEYASLNIPSNMKKHFPHLVEIVQKKGIAVTIDDEEIFAKNFPKNLTRLVLQSGDFKLEWLKYLPNTLTELKIATESPLDDAERSNQNNSGDISEVHLPPALTRLSICHKGGAFNIFEYLPQTLTDLSVRAEFSTNFSWKPLPPLLTYFRCEGCDVTSGLDSCLPPSLLSLRMRFNKPPENAFLETLPSSLTYLALDANNGLSSPLLSTSMQQLTAKLPPNLTGLHISWIWFSDLAELGSLNLLLPSATVRRIISEKTSPSSEKASGKGVSNSSGSSEAQRLTIDLCTSRLKQNAEINTSTYPPPNEWYWKVPEQYAQVQYSCMVDPASLVSAPASTMELVIGGSHHSYDTDPKFEPYWAQALEHIQLRLYRLEALIIPARCAQLKPLVAGMRSTRLKSLDLALESVSDDPKFPPSLREIFFYDYAEPRPLPLPFHVNQLLVALPSTLTILALHASTGKAVLAIPAESLALLPRSLTALRCAITSEGNIVAEPFIHLPSGLEKLQVAFCKKFEIFSPAFARVLPRSLRKLTVTFENPIDSSTIDVGEASNGFFQSLPKGFSRLKLEHRNILDERELFLQKRTQ